MSDALVVRRHEVRGRVPRGAAVTFNSFNEALGPLLEDRLAAHAPTARDGVWLVRGLDVHACVGLHWSARRVAGALAARISGELTDVLARGADGERVLWFPDRATFLGRYLVDRATGRAGGRWEYAAFTGGGIDAIVREPSVGLAALRQLPAPDFEAVLASLSPLDAGLALEAFESCASGADDPEFVVIAAVRRLLDASDLRGDSRVVTLAVLVEAARHRAPPRGTGARAHDAAVLLSLGGEQLARVASSLELGDWRSIVGELGARAMETLSGLAAWGPLARADLVRAVSGARAGRPSDTQPTEEMFTPLGGMFLLLPLLEELPWVASTAAWPALDGVGPAALAQYFAVAGALGPARHAAAARDRVLRSALGIPPELDVAAMSVWGRAVPPPEIEHFDRVPEFVLGRPFDLPHELGEWVASMSHRLLYALARRLPGFAVSTPGYLRENVLACAATVQIEPACFIVRLTNPPLGVLLSLTGLNRKRFRLDATGDAEWCLTQV